MSKTRNVSRFRSSLNRPPCVSCKQTDASITFFNSERTPATLVAVMALNILFAVPLEEQDTLVTCSQSLSCNVPQLPIRLCQQVIRHFIATPLHVCLAAITSRVLKAQMGLGCGCCQTLLCVSRRIGAVQRNDIRFRFFPHHHEVICCARARLRICARVRAYPPLIDPRHAR